MGKSQTFSKGGKRNVDVRVFGDAQVAKTKFQKLPNVVGLPMVAVG